MRKQVMMKFFIAFFLAALAAILSYLYLKKDYTIMVFTKTYIPPYTVIRGDMVEEKEVPADYANLFKDSVGNMEKIVGCITISSFPEGYPVISNDKFLSPPLKSSTDFQQSIQGGNENNREFIPQGCSVVEIDVGEAGNLLYKGDIIDLYITGDSEGISLDSPNFKPLPNEGSPDVLLAGGQNGYVFKNVMIYRGINVDGNEDKKTVSVLINKQYQDLLVLNKHRNVNMDIVKKAFNDEKLAGK